MQISGYDPWFLAKHPIRLLRDWWGGRIAALGLAAAIFASVIGVGLSTSSEQLVAAVIGLGSFALGESIYGFLNWRGLSLKTGSIQGVRSRALMRIVGAVAAGVFAGAALKELGANDTARIFATIAIAIALLQVASIERLNIADEALRGMPAGCSGHKEAQRDRLAAFHGVLAQAMLTALSTSIAVSALIVEALGKLSLVFLVPVSILVIGLSIRAAELDHLPR